MLWGTWNEIWKKGQSTIDLELSNAPDELEYRFHFPKTWINIRWFALEKLILLMQKFTFSKFLEISGFETFISEGFI